MATGQTLINRALRLIGAIASGKSPTAQESTDALEGLNAMLGSWQVDQLTVYAFQTESFTLTAGQASYTVGPSGQLATVRPVKLVQAVLQVNGVDTPISMFTPDQWFALPSKTLAGTPECLYYEGTVPLGALQLFPVPSEAYTLQLVTWVPLTAITLGATVVLPPGYERALAYNLALELGPEYGQAAKPAIVKIAQDSLAAIRRANMRPIGSTKELAGLFTRST